MEELSAGGDPDAVQVVGDVTNGDDVVCEQNSDTAAGTTYTEVVGEVTNDDDVVREYGRNTAVVTTDTQVVGEVSNDDDNACEYYSDTAVGTTDTGAVGEVTDDDEEVRGNGSDTAVETVITQGVGGGQKDVRTTVAGGMTVGCRGRCPQIFGVLSAFSSNVVVFPIPGLCQKSEVHASTLLQHFRRTGCYPFARSG